MLISVSPYVPTDAAEALIRFVAHAQLMLDPATPEPLRRNIEPQLLALLPTIKALGLFDLVEIRDPAMRALIQDEMAQRRGLRLAKEFADA
ncbi:hypothetical protein [Dyella sp.]|uniref:hypothetical protein n=1 Tax=Dyella sp. TaxID=1869338 RepID=UPI002ED2E125